MAPPPPLALGGAEAALVLVSATVLGGKMCSAIKVSAIGGWSAARAAESTD